MMFLLVMKAKLALLVLCWLVAARGMAQIEPGAGAWKTWVIPSGAAYRLPPPPSAKATRAEARTLQQLAQQRDSAALRQIRYWDAGAPGYRWQAVLAQQPGSPLQRVRSAMLLNVAIYDATVAAWDTKYAYRRPRPAAAHADIRSCLPTPDSPSYPCERAVAAGAAAGVLTQLFPAKADSLRQLALAACHSRVLAGVAYPSDAQAGFELGQRVAAAVLARVQADSADAPWKGRVPTQAGLWHDKRPPLQPLRGHWRPLVLASGRQFRPGPPPEPAAGMRELRAFKMTPQAMERAFYWATTDYWGEACSQKLFENNLGPNAPRAARVYALVSVAGYDASIACWDAKYAYWSIRPDQYDPTYAPPLMVTPPHPSYPSGHATMSGARAVVLGYLFPEDAKLFIGKAQEAAESRFEGGVHFRVDNTVGLAMGQKVGAAVVKYARQDGADAPHKVASR